MKFDAGGIILRIPKAASKWWHSKHKVARRFRSFARLMGMSLDVLETLAADGQIPYFEYQGEKYVIQLESNCSACTHGEIQWTTPLSEVENHES